MIPKSLLQTGLHSSQIGLTLSLGALVMGVGSLLFGRVSDKVGRNKTLLIGLLGIILLLAGFSEALKHDPPNFYGQLPIIGPGALMMTAIVPSALAYIGDKARKDLRGSAMGLYSMMLSLGIGFGNIFGGYFTQLEY